MSYAWQDPFLRVEILYQHQNLVKFVGFFTGQDEWCAQTLLKAMMFLCVVTPVTLE
jgi:hypothetical protein